MRGEVSNSHDVRLVPGANVKHLACHPEQADVAQRRIWAIRAKRRAAFIKKSRDAKFARLDLASLDRFHFRLTHFSPSEKCQLSAYSKRISMQALYFEDFAKKSGRSPHPNSHKTEMLARRNQKNYGVYKQAAERTLV
jgi:hypothetical protein